MTTFQIDSSHYDHGAPSRDDIDSARTTLSEYVLDHAARTAHDIGFGYVGQQNAPNTYDALTAAYERSVATGEPLPISNEHSTDVIFISPEVNVAHRFVHDVHHCRLGLDFGLVDELELAIWHLDRLEDAGIDPSSLEWQLLHADLIGQIQINAFARRFPSDQRKFGLDCILLGFERGILSELRRSA